MSVGQHLIMGPWPPWPVFIWAFVQRLGAGRQIDNPPEQCLSADRGACVGRLHAVKGPKIYDTTDTAYLVDLDLDGLVDVMDVDDDGQVLFQKRLPNGSLHEPQPVAHIGGEYISSGVWGRQLQAADWDGDGDLDLFVFNSDGAGRSSYFEQVANASGSSYNKLPFQSRTGQQNPVTSVKSILPVQVLDWDQDGDFDILFCKARCGELNVDPLSATQKNKEPEFGFLENINGRLEPRVGNDNPLAGFRTTAPVISVHAADWDQDGDPDLLVLTLLSSLRYGHKARVLYFEQLSGGSFLQREPLGEAFVTWFRPAMQVIDWDDDGIMDLRYTFSVTKRSLVETLLPWNGASMLSTLGLSLNGLTFVDWDHDGLTDVLDAGNGDLRFFRSGSDGSLAYFPEQFPQVYVDSDTILTAADWDGDGDADLITRDANGLLRYYERLNEKYDPSLVEVATLRFPSQTIAAVQLFAVDWTSDGRTDLLYFNAETGKLVLWEQLANGTLADRGSIAIPRPANEGDFGEIQALAIVDYNNDGQLDVVSQQKINFFSQEGHVVLFERNGSDQLMNSRQLFSYPRYKYRSSLHVVPWGVSQQLHIIIDHEMWSTGFCIKPGACADHGVCAPSGCNCAAAYQGASDCSRCSANHYAPARAFGANFQCLRCAGDEQVCAARGVCEDDYKKAKKARDSGSNVSAVLVSGNGSCQCSEVFFHGADELGRVTCAEGTCPAGSIQARRDTEDGSAVYRCEVCSNGSVSFGGRCASCSPGRTSRGNECVACEAGRFAIAAAATACAKCPAGTWSWEGQTRCAVCTPGKAAESGSSQCTVCQAGRFAASEAATECAECPAGKSAIAAQSACTPCSSGAVSGPGSEFCEQCASMLWKMTSVDHQHCRVDLSGLAYLALFTLSALGFCYLLITSFTFQLDIVDLSSIKGASIVATQQNHRLLHWSWAQPSVRLKNTGLHELEAAGVSHQVKAKAGKSLELSRSNDAEKALGLCGSTSMGVLQLSCCSFWLCTGWLGAPFCVWQLILFGVSLFASSRVQSLMRCVVPGLLLIFVAAAIAWRRASPKTPIDQAHRHFARQLLEDNPNPQRCERGAARALRLDKLREFYDFFNAFILDRSMYYVCSNLVIPLTKPWKLSYAELAGPGEVMWFVSHYWGMGLRHTLETLTLHSRTQKCASDAASYWICTFSNNQWQVVEELGGGDWRDSWTCSSGSKSSQDVLGTTFAWQGVTEFL